MRGALLVGLLAGCGSADTSGETNETDLIDTDVVDTDLVDTDLEDTDVEDTDVEDTDAEDTDNPGLDAVLEGVEQVVEVAAGGEKRLWLRGFAGQGHLVTVVAATTGNANAEITTKDGVRFVGAGWCCVVPNRQALYVPPAMASPGVILVIRNTSDAPGSYSVTSVAAGDASAAAGAVAWTPGSDGWNQLGDRIGLGEDRYVRISPPHVGPYRFQVSGSNDPIVTAFTDPTNIAGSTVTFINGACRPGTSGASCVVFLEKDTWLKIEDAAGDATELWIVGFAPDTDYVRWTDPSTGRLTLPAGAKHHGWLSIDRNTSAQLTLVSVSAAFGDGGFYEPDRSMRISNGFCCGVGNTLRYFLPPGRAWDAVETQVASWPENTEDLVVDFLLETVADGTSAAAAVPYTSGTANHVLDNGEKRYLSWKATGSGATTFQANGMSWASVKAGLQLRVYTDPSDSAGSTLVTCAPTYETDYWQTLCSFDATSGSTYGIELSQGAADDVMFAILEALTSPRGVSVQRA